MNKSDVLQLNTALRIDPPTIVRFQCPICLKIVPERDFITSYRLIENIKTNTHPAYQIKNLCRSCRDSGQ